MAQHDRTRCVSRHPAWWPSDRTLRWIVDQHSGLFNQLEPLFGARIACEMVIATVMRIRL